MQNPSSTDSPRTWDAKAGTAVAQARQALPWLVVVGLSAALIAWVGQWAAHNEADTQGQAIRRALEVQTLALRGTAAKYNYLPYTVAQQPEVRAALAEPNNPAKRHLANVYLEAVNLRAGSDALYVMDARGTTLIASNWNESKSFVGESYANRPYFMDAHAGRSGLFYGVGKTTGVPGLFIATPVNHAGKVVGVVAVKVSLRQIEQAWTHARDPIALSDENGIVFLGNVASWLYRATRDLAPEEFERVCTHEQYGACKDIRRIAWSVTRTQGEAEYLVKANIGKGSRQFLALDAPLPEFGWTLTVMADQVPVGVARKLAWLLGSLAFGVVLLGGLYWQQRERRFAEQRIAQRELEARVVARTRDLQQADAFRKAMEDSLPVGMAARDLDGRIIYVNPALCTMVGYRYEELIGCMPPYPFWHPDDLQKHWQENQVALSGQSPLAGFESRMRHRAGRDVDTMIYTAPLVDASGQHSGWMSSVLDTTEQKRADERQRQNDLKMQQTGRLVSLGEMASTLAHELNQPLMALSNFASAAKTFAEQGKQTLLVASLDDITAQAQRSGEIVRRIRGFVKQHAEGMQDCAVNSIVGNVLVLLKAEIKQHGARVQSHLQADIPMVKGDRVLLEQVLLNLVLNSLQAMANTPKARRLVSITSLVLDGFVCVRVADGGPGVAPESEEHLFKSFFTTKSDGLGLGLKICRTIIESHRGRLEFQNQPDSGALFTVYLPCTP